MCLVSQRLLGCVLWLQHWGSFVVSTVLSCVLEACTSQIDNLFLPLHYYACLRIFGSPLA